MCMGEKRNAYTVLWENVKERDCFFFNCWNNNFGKRLCLTLSCRWEDSMNPEEMGWEVVDWSHLAEDVDKL